MRPPTGLPSLSRRSRALLVAAVVLAALLLVGPRLVDTYTDFLWFGAVDFRGVYMKMLLTRVAIFAVVALVVGAVVWLALWLGYRSRPVFVPAGPNDPISRYRTTVMSRLRLFGIGIPAVIGILAGLVAQSSWVTVQLFLHGGSFGRTDPEFGLDVGFYAFDLPFYQMALNWLFVAVVIAFFANLATHYIFGGLRLTGREGTLTTAARVQLAALAGTFVLFKAIAYWFDRYELLMSSRKEPTFNGGSFTDINAVLPAKLILLAIAVICALAFFAGIVLKDLRVPAMAAALLVLSSVLVGAVWPLLVEQFSVRPNAAEKESEYIERNIEATRSAYDITNDKIDYVPYQGTSEKHPVDVPVDQTTIANARLLDPNILSPTFTQLRQLKNFYGFPEVLDIDRYDINGEIQDYIVGARELSPSTLSGNQTDWINKHTVYTHGNGFVAAPANRVNRPQSENAADGGGSSDSGYPIFLTSDLFTPKDEQRIKVDQPRIYYGELISRSNPDYAIVGATKEGEAPREYDSDNAQYTYDGAGGVSVGNWFNRLAFAAKYTERNILFSSAIGDESKLLFNRSPRERVQKVAPWLTTDGNAYPAVVDGRIKWIVDAYTTLDEYPYSQKTSLDGALEDSIDQRTGRMLPRKEVGYIRNSVKATVDAYDGSVSLYETDPEDPVLQAWRGIFPDAVKPESEISPELRAHFRYPEDLFKVQRELLSKYHVDDPREFFTNNAFWSVPADPTVEGPSAAQPPYYVLLGDPKTGEPVFNLTSAMVGYNRQFLSAYISVRSDPANYGRFRILQLPTDTQTLGPQQTQNRMTTAPEVSQEKTLLSNSNTIRYGNLLTLPIADGGILYVEPFYNERNTGPDTATFPQLLRVLVSYRDSTGTVKVGYASTLAEAMDQVLPGAGDLVTPFGGDPATRPTANGGSPDRETAQLPGGAGAPPTEGAVPSPSSPAQEAAAAELERRIQSVRSAMRTGNFEEFGRALDDLETAVKQYQESGG